VCSATQYQLLGLVLGLAVYNRVLLDFPLPMAAYKKVSERAAALGEALTALGDTATIATKAACSSS
jgi:hypothetical protein